MVAKRSSTKQHTSSTGAARARVGRPRNGAKENDTRQDILTAAEDVLIKVGYANFTTRKVAAAAGIAIGNLTYHFPNKADLTEALIEFILNRYVEHIRASRALVSTGAGNHHPLADLARWAIDDAVTPHIGRVCRELWAMACHQKFAARAMDTFYRKVTQEAAQVARAEYPNMTEREAIHLTYFMAVLSEGAVVLFGTLPDAQKLLPGVTALAVRAIEHLAGSAEDQRPP